MAAAPSTSSAFNRLPVELHLQVMGHLSALDVASLGETSRYWSALAQHHWAHLRLPFVHRPWDSPATLKDVACERERMLRSLTRPLDHAGPQLGAALLTRADELFQHKLYPTALVAWSGVDEATLTPEARARLAQALLITQQYKAGMEHSIAVAAESPDALHNSAGHMKHAACQPYLRPLLAAWNASPEAVNSLWARLLRTHKDSAFMAELVTHPLITANQKAAACSMGVRRGNLLLLARTLPCVASEEQHTLLCEALTVGNLRVAQFLYDRGAPFNDDRHPCSALLSAVTSGDLACVEWAVGLTTTEVRGDRGCNVWHAFVWSHREMAPENVRAIAELLRGHGTNAAQADNHNSAPLKLALKLMDEPTHGEALATMVDCLLGYDATTSLMHAGALGLVRHGDEALLRKAMARGLLLDPPSPVEAEERHRPLFFLYAQPVAFADDILDRVFHVPGAVSLLHRVGYDLTSWHGRPPLKALLELYRHTMATESWLRVGKELVDAGCGIHGSSMNTGSSMNKTALMLLASLERRPWGNPRQFPDGEAATKAFANAMALLEYLLQSGADVHAVDANGQTALHYAITEEATTLLLNHGADREALDYEWRPALEEGDGAAKRWRPQTYR